MSHVHFHSFLHQTSFICCFNSKVFKPLEHFLNLMHHNTVLKFFVCYWDFTWCTNKKSYITVNWNEKEVCIFIYLNRNLKIVTFICIQLSAGWHFLSHFAEAHWNTHVGIEMCFSPFFKSYFSIQTESNCCRTPFFCNYSCGSVGVAINFCTCRDRQVCLFFAKFLQLKVIVWIAFLNIRCHLLPQI